MAGADWGGGLFVEAIKCCLMRLLAMGDYFSDEFAEQITPLLDGNDLRKFKLLRLDYKNAFTRMAKQSTPANRKNHDEAEEAFTLFAEHLEQRYLSKDDAGQEVPETFATKASVWEFLKGEEYIIGRSQFYQHCKDGLLRPRRGEYLLKDVTKYAKLHLRRADSGEIESDRERRIREEKLELSLQKEQVLLDKEKFDLSRKQGKFIPRADFEQAIVARAVAFMAHLNHSFQSAVPDLIDIVEGDQQRAGEMVEALSRLAEERMADFAVNAEFDVILEANE